jgi:polyribonucleotide nucleotidyltransferase
MRHSAREPFARKGRPTVAHVVVERDLGGRKLKIETGKWAKQASGAALVALGETVVFAGVSDQSLRPGLDFFPLTVDYRERGYAAGMIFGGRFRKREGAPSEKETLTMRLIDRPIRPLWPDGYSRDVLIQCFVLSAEPDVDPDVVAMIASSAALSVSPLPFQGPTGSVRVGFCDGQYVLNPGVEQLKTSQLELVVSGTRKAVLMVEAGANELSEEQMIGGIEFAHKGVLTVIDAIDELASKSGVKKLVFESPAKPAIYDTILKNHADDFKKAAWTVGKFARRDARKALAEKMVEKYAAKDPAAQPEMPTAEQVQAACEHAWERTIRRQIVENKRCDGRTRTDVRPISSEVGVLPRVHGSALFTRGETQALATVTMGTPGDEQTVECLRGEYNDRFLLHYNFPSFCVGEVKMPRGPGRREIGHGNLARRGIKACLPDYETFPYTLRIVSEIMESNGSSSMASVCGGTLALLDAGVPMKAPVAGIAMGLVEEDGQHFIVTDILGDEDHYGDMDFKVAGSEKGVTALQMDLKSAGISFDVMRKALDQAREGRKHILGEMAKTLAKNRDSISQYAPKIVQLKIPVDKIGKLIGPGGKMIRALEEKHTVTIDVQDDGTVTVSSPKRDQADACVRDIEGLTGTPEVGKVYMGEVVNIKEFGVFFEIMPGVDGMCHVSELDTSYVKNPSEFCKMGDKMEVKLLSVDDLGRLKLSRKALLLGTSAPAEGTPAGGAAPSGEGQRPQGGGDRGGNRGGGRLVDREGRKGGRR